MRFGFARFGFSALRLWCAVVCVGVLFACLPGERGRPGRHQRAIIGGSKDLRHPAVGALTQTGKSFCTATLIASRVVLTAAHCIDAARDYVAAKRELHFRIDLPDTSAPEGFQAHPLLLEQKLLFTHPKWDPTDVSGGYDLGVAILQKATTLANPIPYNTSALSETWVGLAPLFLGYGLTQSKPSAASATSKQGADIPILMVLPDRIVHGAPTKSVCHGDSGGPALFPLNGRLQVIAINSYVTADVVPRSNPPRSACDAAGVSYRTDVYPDFLRDLLRKYGDGTVACKSDDMCGACGRCDATNRRCAPRPLTATATHCKPCFGDRDCGPDGLCHKTSDGFRCLQACSATGCCPQGASCSLLSGPTAQRWVCRPLEGRCPTVSCQSARDCGARERCHPRTRRCQPSPPARSPRLCHPCKQHADCGGAGHLCIGPQDAGHCAQPCSPEGLCPPGTVCQTPYPGTPKQCLPPDGACSIPCTDSSSCPKGFSCQASVCRRDGGGLHGDPCTDTCKTPFQCIATAYGKRCLQPCGTPAHSPGDVCDAKKQCLSPGRCYNAGAYDFCISACEDTAECKKKGGGLCSGRGNCLCEKQSECEEGYFCNFSSGFFGACVATKSLLQCPDGRVCRNLNAGTFCVAQDGGTRSLGQLCDALHACSPGLVCLDVGTRAACYETCSATQPCRLGGTCTTLSEDFSICLCKDGDCSLGRRCVPFFRGTEGVCQEPPHTASTCIDSLECPPAHICQQGICSPIPDNPTPSPEQPKTEAIQPKEPPRTPEIPAATESSPEPADAAPPTEGRPILILDETPEPQPPQQGCGCQHTHDNPPPTWLLLLLLLLLPPAARAGSICLRRPGVVSTPEPPQ